MLRGRMKSRSVRKMTKPYTPPRGDIRNVERGKRLISDMIKDSEAKDKEKQDEQKRI